MNPVCDAPYCQDSATVMVQLVDPYPAGFPTTTVLCDDHLGVVLNALQAWNVTGQVTRWA